MAKQASILVVDDDLNNFKVIEILLLRDGYALDYAANGSEALNYLVDNQPDLILLDVMMPEVNGIEVCRQVKQSPCWKHIPIIMVTALNEKEDLSRCIEAGADDFVGKPVNGIELRARVRSMLRIKRQYDALQSTLQLQEDMSNMIVHDLRNPLTTILLASSILQAGELQPKQRRKAEQITIAGQQLQALIDSLLLMAKLESGNLVLDRIETDVCKIAALVISDFEAIAAQKNIELISQLSEPTGTVWVDVPVFRRVLDNLLSNAIKFSPSSSQVTLRIDYPPQLQVRIQVRDSGPGVSEELRQSIFEKYEIGQLVKEVPQTGLGLAFCKMAIAAHDGKIFVENDELKGAVFTIEL